MQNDITAEKDPPAVPVPGGKPVKVIRPDELKLLGQTLNSKFDQYKSDRRIAELRWTRNLRQYLGIYDPELDNLLAKNRSRAYPRITRVKCISVLSRIMNLMFPGNERNWELKASPNADMDVDDVNEAIQEAVKADEAAGMQPEMSLEFVMAAVMKLAQRRAEKLMRLIDDQLQELGGDQTFDYVQLNRRALQSGILYGLGVLRGPYVRSQEVAQWSFDQATRQAAVKKKTVFKPLFEFLPIWDFFPDMSAKTLAGMDGYFTRQVMSREQVSDLMKRDDFFADQIKTYLARNTVGNYKPQPFETDLRTMGVKINVNEMKADTSKYEVIAWHGPVTTETLQHCGVEIPKDHQGEMIKAEIWMIDGWVIKADINPWVELGMDVRTIHCFLFDEDDTSPVGAGLPNVIRDSQMSICAATRMLLDNASVTCGPQIELNLDLMRLDQDLSSIEAFKIWLREGTGPDAQYPAVRNVQIDGHMDELLKMIELFMKFADTETFVGPATGGDMEKAPSEPMRTAAGASMLRGDAALPFKDIVRNFDSFTQSIIQALVQFNRKFNPDQAPQADYDVIARGATSLIAKEIRGMQLDQIAQTLTPEEKLHVDERKLVEARFAVRDMTDILVPEDVAARRKAQQDQAMQAQAEQAKQMAEANVRKLLADAFKSITQGNKNAANADAEAVQTALAILEKGLQDAIGGGATNGSGNDPQNPAGAPRQLGGPANDQAAGAQAGAA